MNHSPIIRRATQEDAAPACSVMIASRHANVPQIPAMVHTDAEVHDWFETTVMPEQEVGVAVSSSVVSSSEIDCSVIQGVLVITPGWVEQLYVDPGRTNVGVGSALVEHAKTQASGTIDLWTFASNLGARRFYERHGFREIGRSGDRENRR